MGAPATRPTTTVRTAVSVTAARAVHATSAASGSPDGIGIARCSVALEMTVIMVTTEVKTVSRPNSAAS